MIRTTLALAILCITASYVDAQCANGNCGMSAGYDSLGFAGGSFSAPAYAAPSYAAPSYGSYSGFGSDMGYSSYAATSRISNFAMANYSTASPAQQFASAFGGCANGQCGISSYGSYGGSPMSYAAPATYADSYTDSYAPYYAASDAYFAPAMGGCADGSCSISAGYSQGMSFAQPYEGYSASNYGSEWSGGGCANGQCGMAPTYGAEYAPSYIPSNYNPVQANGGCATGNCPLQQPAVSNVPATNHSAVRTESMIRRLKRLGRVSKPMPEAKEIEFAMQDGSFPTSYLDEAAQIKFEATPRTSSNLNSPIGKAL